MAGGDFISVHRRRNQDPEYDALTALNEQPPIERRHNCPVEDSEPQRIDSFKNPLGMAYLQGILARGLNLRTIFHSTQAREAQKLTGIELAAYQEMLRGFDELPGEARYTYHNANNTGSWPDSPCQNASFEDGPGLPGKSVWRVPSFLGERNVSVAYGRDPANAAYQWHPAWRSEAVGGAENVVLFGLTPR
jgi:hypothetical protein